MQNMRPRPSSGMRESRTVVSRPVRVNRATATVCSMASHTPSQRKQPASALSLLCISGTFRSTVRFFAPFPRII